MSRYVFVVREPEMSGGTYEVRLYDTTRPDWFSWVGAAADMDAAAALISARRRQALTVPEALRYDWLGYGDLVARRTAAQDLNKAEEMLVDWWPDSCDMDIEPRVSKTTAWAPDMVA